MLHNMQNSANKKRQNSGTLETGTFQLSEPINSEGISEAHSDSDSSNKSNEQDEMYQRPNSSRKSIIRKNFYNQETQVIDLTIKIVIYAPNIFKYLRFKDGINEQSLIDSLEPSRNRHQIFKTNRGQKHNNGGKSGSFFFFTEDRSLIIKTIGKHEKRKLLKMLPNICKYSSEKKEN
jgi:hypothetical protein